MRDICASGGCSDGWRAGGTAALAPTAALAALPAASPPLLHFCRHFVAQRALQAAEVPSLTLGLAQRGRRLGGSPLRQRDMAGYGVRMEGGVGKRGWVRACQ